MSRIERIDQRAAYVSSSDSLKGLQDRLRGHVIVLAQDIGPRSYYAPGSLERTREYIRGECTKVGYEVRERQYSFDGSKHDRKLPKQLAASNIEIEIPGRESPDEIVLVGAHYDSVELSPGANDNASGVASLLELSCALLKTSPKRTIRFVAFANEEPPFYSTESMGSVVYAREAKERRNNIVGMIALDEIGYYSDEEDSQIYPPNRLSITIPMIGNFLAFVGNRESKDLTERSISAFWDSDQFPAEMVIVEGPANVIGGLVYYLAFQEAGMADHSAFWARGYPAILVTDTAMFRYPAYHTYVDTPDKIDYPSLTLVTKGLINVVKELSGVRE